MSALERQSLNELKKQMRKGTIPGKKLFNRLSQLLKELYVDAVDRARLPVLETLNLVVSQGKRDDGSSDLIASVIGQGLKDLANQTKTREYATYLICSLGKLMGSLYFAGGAVQEVIRYVESLCNLFIGPNSLLVEIEPNRLEKVRNSTDLILVSSARGVVISVQDPQLSFK